MIDPTAAPDPKLVREIARKLLLNAANDLAPSEAGRSIGATVMADAGARLSMLEYTAWFEAVYEDMQTARFNVSWPDETPANEPDLSGWSADENAEFEKMYGVRAAMRLRAANNRAWAVVQWLRDEAVKAGHDPYQDRIAQRLSAALVGAEQPRDVED